MRVDMELLLSRCKGSKLLKYFQEIVQLEEYTLLIPPYRAEDAESLLERAQKRLGVRLSPAYKEFMKCCDGGALFTNQIYSLLCPENEDEDLVERNQYLRSMRLIPEGSIAIGETNYGAYIVQCASGRNAMGLWDGEYIVRFGNLFEWLDDVLDEAHFLLAEDALSKTEEDNLTEEMVREATTTDEKGELLFE